MDTTARVSRVLFNTIAERAEIGESKDTTLRRLLFGQSARRKKNWDAPMPHIKLSRALRNFIRQQAQPRESVDDTVRRLLQVVPGLERGAKAAIGEYPRDARIRAIGG
jgi:hypothetical protein